MKLEELKKIAEARTKGEWTSQAWQEDRKYYEQEIADCEFIAMASNNFSKLLDVVEAAKESLKDADPLFKSTERLAKALEALGVKDEGIYYNCGGLG